MSTSHNHDPTFKNSEIHTANSYNDDVFETNSFTPEEKKHKKLPPILDWLDENLENVFVVIGLLSIIFFITLQTAYRYIITTFTETAGAMVWTEEVSRYIFIWITYLSLSIAIKKRSSIRVEIIYDMLPKRWQNIFNIITDMCFLILTLIIMFTGWSQIERLIRFPQHTTALQIPYLIPYLILPFGFGLMTIRIIQGLKEWFKICGKFDSIIGVVLSLAIWLPIYPILAALYIPALPYWYDYLSPIPVLFLYFIGLCAIGVPVAISLGLSAVATIICAETVPIQYVAQTAFTSIDSFPIMAIPFFIATGVFMGAGGLSSRLLAFADEMIGGLYGGMALTAVVTCVFFGAISGSGPATVAAIGALTIPAMIDRGYDKYFATALVAAAGAIGVMIPPSNPFVVYGVSAQVSIGDLFIGGIVPGLLTAAVLMIYTYFHSKKKNYRGVERERTAMTKLKALWDAKWAMLVPVIVLGGIYGGLMTPTEAAAVAAFYGLVVGLFVYKELTIQSVINCCKEAAESSATIIVLMAMATIFGYIMTIEDVPGTIAKAILSVTNNKIFILLLINVLLLAVGVFMEALAAIVILTPILLPIVVSAGVSPLHFGIVMVVNLAIGFITPPVGVNLFVASSVSKTKLADISKHVVPMILLMIGVLLLITFVPSVSLFLVN